MKIFTHFFIMFLFPFALLAKESVRISEILDTNLFLTDTGRFISLANVETISIRDEDSLRAEFAHTVFAGAVKMLNGKQCEIEQITLRDSVEIVLMWAPVIVGKKLVNGFYLEKGWGFFKETPANRSLEEFRWRAQRAKAAQIGMYTEKAKEQPLLLPDAFWLSGGIGTSKAAKTGRRYYMDYLNINASIAFRHQLWMGDVGVNEHGTDCHSIRTFYLTFGASSHNRVGELTAAIGPSLSRWTYNTESEQFGTVHSDDLIGAMIKVQAFVHAPHLIGFGFELSANFNTDQTTYLMSINLHWGEWNF
jgi:hypothetical protein